MTDTNVAADQLKSFVERIERLEEEKSGIADDIKSVYSELKVVGFDAKAVKTIIALRKKSKEEREEQEAIVELYLTALGY